MTPGSYKREARRRTAQRVDAKTRALDPAAGLDREFGDRIERDDAAELARLRSECAVCEACGHYQAEPNWCHVCRHRTTPPAWALPLLDAWQQRQDLLEAAEDAIEALSVALKSDPRLVSPPVEGRSQDTTTPEEGGSPLAEE